ncbi:MAG: 5-(carboxyamino)imidazole ribonucleotide synthase [Betaproteobacteria bacterium]|nr:5-(carboxyamino)imidazole ribonucleotide synthase [Betaproteobacteria bacterium]
MPDPLVHRMDVNHNPIKIITIGVMGGGQLGRMLAHAAQRLGMRVVVLDPQLECPAAQAADHHIQAAYDDNDALDELARICDAITTEFENVPAPSLLRLAQSKPVRPSAKAVAIAQDRLEEKLFFQQQGIDTARFWALERHLAESAQEALDRCREAVFPAILKTRRLGYDGLSQVACLLEERLSLRFELSVILVRDQTGQVAVYPAIENRHRNGILERSDFPAPRDREVAEKARDLAAQVASGLDYEGVLCLEFFVVGQTDDPSGWRLLANEMAPRPHNSGHVTIDACAVSQFEQQARVLAGLPMGDCEAKSKACLLNLLGDHWFDQQGRWREPDWQRLLAIEGLHLHLYGKRQAKPGRKMGHISLDERVAYVISLLERS